jgi:ATP-dependent RNA helicase RhlE
MSPGRDQPAAPESFDAFGLDPALLRAVRELGFVRPTPIQAMALGPLLEGRDVLGAAMTGSGKTAAFGLPILQRLLGKPRGQTRALVLAPTRELAAQIAEHLEALARHTRLGAAAIFGGVGMQPQVDAFRRGVDVLVATPGRLLDHMQHDYARLTGLEILVIDEADRMLDMGFLPDVKRVLARLPVRRQGMLFSATMPAPIVELSRVLLREPLALNIERKSAPARGITHEVYSVADDLKPDLLAALVRQGRYRSVLAFTRTKHRANRLADLLEKRGVACTRIHGNRSQTRRTEALSGFKDGTFKVMVATDIAARGIDVTELALVVNVDVPHLPEDYIHRVGRTARADATGLAITLVSREEEADLAAIERHLGRRLPRQHLHGFDYQRRPEERFEIPIGVRIAEIRKRKAEERLRSREKAERKAAAETARAKPARPAATRPAASRPAAGPARNPYSTRPAAVQEPSGEHRRRNPRRRRRGASPPRP